MELLRCVVDMMYLCRAGSSCDVALSRCSAYASRSVQAMLPLAFAKLAQLKRSSELKRFLLLARPGYENLRITVGSRSSML
jgi:hypothetical protein